MILVKNLGKRFGGDQVLKGLNLEVGKEETLVIMGRSGCGKSVLLKLISLTASRLVVLPLSSATV